MGRKQFKRMLAGNWWGGSNTVVGFEVRKDLGWRKLEERREEKKIVIWMEVAENSENGCNIMKWLSRLLG